MGSKNKKLNLDKDTLYDLYINQQMTSKEIGDLFDCTSKSVRNYLHKYEIEVRSMADSVKLERSKWSEEKEQKRSLKFMTTWKGTPQDVKQEIIARRTKNINSPEAIAKARETRLRNGTTKTSKVEIDYYNKLCSIFGENDVIHEYSDSRYPFACDFYVKSKDLFIEYQGHQTHGYEPYDSSSVEHKDYLNQMSAKYDMTTWVKRDPYKLKVAIDNKINLLLIYPRNNAYFVKNGNMTNVGRINPVDISDID